MEQQKTFRKYQVYFFLYLAVICELLIIIVERDDAELQLRRERDQLIELTQRIVNELLETSPVQSLNGSNQMEVGETRRFVIMLQGMGPEDEVTVPPSIMVLRNGREIDCLRVGEHIEQISDESVNGKRVFAFNWRAPAPGEYEFRGESSINRLGILPTGEVKIASLSFPYEMIAALVPDLPERINDFERLEADLRVKVIARGDQLELHGGDIVTAAGFQASRYVEVQGTSAAKVHAAVNHGMMDHVGDRMVWRHTFARPDDYRVIINAADNRGAGRLSRSHTAFNVSVKWPVSKSKTTDAFAGELFRKNLAVAGLEDRTRYHWTVTLDGVSVAEGRGAMAELQLSEHAAGKRLIVSATYDGQPYPIALDAETLGESRFSYNVLEAPPRFRNISFSRNAEYAVNQEFRFDVYVCGSCISVNRRPPARVSIDAESESGRDLLDDYIYEPILDSAGRQIGTRVKFYLSGRVDRDGEEVLFTMRSGDAIERIPVVIFPD